MEEENFAFNKSNYDVRYKLLMLIEEGDAARILSTENFKEYFNDLIKYELVVLDKDKLSLTEQGKLALKVGVKKVIARIKINLLKAKNRRRYRGEEE